MPLPREVQLIIEDISNQKEHLLEWEVFGNSSEDMRVVLTWRHAAGSIRSLPQSDSIKQWKLRQTSFSTDDAGDSTRNSPMNLESDLNLKKNLQDSSTGIKESSVSNETDKKEKGDLQTDKSDTDSKESRSHSATPDISKEADGPKKENKSDTNDSNRETNDSNRESPKDMKPKKKNPFRKVKKDEKPLKKGKLNLNLSVDTADESSANKNENLLKEKIDEHPEEGDKSGENDINKSKNISKLEDDSEKQRKKRDNSEQFYKNKKNESEQKDGQDDQTNESEDKKDIIQLEDEDGVKRKKRPGYDENQEWSRRKENADENNDMADENSDINNKSNAGSSNQKISNADDPNDETQRRKGELEEQEWKKKQQETNEVENEFNDEQDKEKQEKMRKELIEKTRKEIEELEKIGDEEETNEMKEARSQQGAQKVLEMQRQKFQMSIDEDALELVKAAEERNNLINASHMNGDVTTTENHTEDMPAALNGENITNIHALSSQDEIPVKDKRKHLKKSKDIEEDVGYTKKGRSKINVVTLDLPPLSQVKPVSEMLGRTEWEGCVDCRYNGFCDNLNHKREYALILLADSKYNEFDSLDCDCIVCNGGAVHNGCVYRELLRLKTDYKLFDKRNFCVCRVCVPFKYRRQCLRQELRVMKEKGKDLYYRLTYDGDDGKEGYHPQGFDSDDSNYHTDDDDDERYPKYIDALSLDDIDLEITKDDKINFRNCIDCQFNGFCDDIRHKKLYLMLLRIDDEDFEDLEDDCSCLVCEYRGAAHNGCALREIRRLKYDLLLFDKRNLCDCKQCIPFKYRSLCLRQEMKLLRRLNGVNLYNKL